MSIYGIGTDIIEIKRIANSIERFSSKFLDRLFSQNEQAYCNKHLESHRNYAGRFAAKEAIAKALGTGFGKELSWLDIEIINDPHGKPEVICSKRLKSLIDNLKIHVTISHCREFATAFAIIEK